MSKKATSEEMGTLHDELAKKLTDIVKNGETVIKAGEPHRVPASAALLGVAARFLKDNNVVCADELPSAPITGLDQALKDFHIQEDEDELPTFPN
jgi:hypothetical protein